MVFPFSYFIPKLFYFFCFRLLICLCTFYTNLLVEFSFIILECSVLLGLFDPTPVLYESSFFRQYLLLYRSFVLLLVKPLLLFPGLFFRWLPAYFPFRCSFVSCRSFFISPSIFISLCPISWSCRILQLHVCRGARPPHECPRYDSEQYDG